MSTTLRRSLTVALAAATVATVTDAAADDRSAANLRSGEAGRRPEGHPDQSGAASAAFSTLPSGRVPLPPKAKAPSTIGANEKVPGFIFAGRPGQRDYVTLVSTPKMAKQLTEGSRTEGPRANDACFAEREMLGARRFEETAEEAWRASMQPTMGMSASAQHGQRPTVTAMHSERVAEEDGRVSLEIIDAWVDPMTRGARLITRSTVPLVLVSQLFEGTKVYAAKDAELVHVILVPSKERKQPGHEGIFAIADSSIMQSSCDHIRATLKTEKGQGQTASFIASVELPSLEPKEPAEPKEAKPDPAAAFQRPRPRAELRVRPVHVHASVTWATRDKDPLLSISAGWDARERLTPVF